MLIDINHIIKLANIRMSDSEIALLEKQLQNIVNWVDMIAKIKTDNIEPMYNRLQDLHIFSTQDKTSEVTVGTEKILENASEVFENFFVVPKVVDNA